jgi:hypothetical protein
MVAAYCGLPPDELNPGESSAWNVAVMKFVRISATTPIVVALPLSTVMLCPAPAAAEM